MNFTPKGLDDLKKFISYDLNLMGKKLATLFQCIGKEDSYFKRHFKLEEGGELTRQPYLEIRLKSINNSQLIVELLEWLINDYSDDITNHLRKLNNIIPEGYSIYSKENKYKIMSNTPKTSEIPKVKPIFEDIKKEIISAIQNAKLSIWIAMGYFTSKDIFDALKIKEAENLDIRFVLSTEKTNEYLKFDNNFKDVRWLEAEIYGTYYNGNDKKAIMHNKYCIIDMKIILIGSYNWTENSEYNAENAIKIECSENALEYAKNFLELRKKARKR